MKKVIKIFLASSITEFATERNELEVFIRNMSDIYEEQYDIKIKPIRCEQIDPYITDSRTQDIINASLDECELCFVLVYTRFGQFSYEEFRHALNKFRESAEHLPKIYVYFKELGDGETADESVVRFMSELNDSLKHYYGTFKNIDTVKLRIALNFVMQKLDISSVSLDEGRLSLNGVEMDGIDLGNVSEFYNSRELTELKSRLCDIEREYYPLHAAFKKGDISDGAADFEKYSNLASERAKLKAEIDSLETDIFNMSVRRSKDEVEGYISERHKAAYRLFEQGDLAGANEVLDEDEIENDYKARKAKIIARKMEELRQNAIIYIREMKTKIDILLMMKGDASYDKALSLYERIIPEAMENIACLDIVHDYAQLLLNRWENSYAQNRNELMQKCLNAELDLLEIYEDNTIATSEDMGITHALVGRAYAAIRDFEHKRTFIADALSNLYKAEEILTPLALRAPDKFNELVKSVFNTIGKIHEELRDFIKAEQYYVKPTRIYLTSGRRMNNKTKRALAENYLGMDTEITIGKALELYLELYETNPEYTDRVAACYRAKAKATFRNVKKVTSYPAPERPELELAIELLNKAIELEKQIASDNAIESYRTIADDYATLATYHYERLGPFDENPDKEQCLVNQAAYLEKLYRLTTGIFDTKYRICYQISDIYNALCMGENHSVSDDIGYSYGCTNDPEKRKYYNEIWKLWEKEKRRLVGNPDLSSRIDDHIPSLTPDEAKKIKQAKVDEEEARKQAEINEAKSPSWGVFTTDISFDTVEEGIERYLEYIDANSMYFDLLKDLIEKNKDDLSPEMMIDTAIRIVRELSQKRVVCADYAIELAEYCVSRDSSLIGKLDQVYYNARNHYHQVDEDKRKKCFSDHFIEFLEALTPDTAIEEKLLSLYGKEIDDAITWSPRNQVEIVESFTLKSIAILKKRAMDIRTARIMADQLQMMSQIKRINGDIDAAVTSLDQVVEIFSTFLGTDDNQSALLGIANVNLSICDLYRKIGNTAKAAEALDYALTQRKTIYENGYKGDASAERFMKAYKKYKDVLITIKKPKLTVHLKDFLEYSEYLYQIGKSRYSSYTSEYINDLDTAISLLESAEHPEGVLEIAQIKLDKMNDLVLENGLRYIDNVKDTLRKLIEYGEILGEDEKVALWREQLNSLTA